MPAPSPDNGRSVTKIATLCGSIRKSNGGFPTGVAMFGDFFPRHAPAVQLAFHQIESGRFHPISINGNTIEQFFGFRPSDVFRHFAEIETPHLVPF